MRFDVPQCLDYLLISKAAKYFTQAIQTTRHHIDGTGQRSAHTIIVAGTSDNARAPGPAHEYTTE
jgi:hypothetical protein